MCSVHLLMIASRKDVAEVKDVFHEHTVSETRKHNLHVPHNSLNSTSNSRVRLDSFSSSLQSTDHLKVQLY